MDDHKESEFLTSVRDVLKPITDDLTPIINFDRILKQRTKSLLVLGADPSSNHRIGMDMLVYFAGDNESLRLAIIELMKKNEAVFETIKSATVTVQLQKMFERGEDVADDCDCPNCVERRRREGKE